MKILITSTLLPPIAGGAEQVAWETAKRINKFKGVEVHILTLGKFGTFKREGIIIHQVPKTPLLTLFYSTIGKPLINHLIKEDKFDIIHCHIPLPWAFILKNYPAKKIITFHGFETGLQRPNLLKRVIESKLINLAIKKFNKFIVPSQFFKREIENYYPIHTEVITNGIDTKKFKPLSNIEQEKNIVLFVGRYIELKGIRELLVVAKELPQYKFWFVGKGPLENEIKGKNVKNLGFKTQEELIKIYNKATICCFPSWHESFGITALEAMACRKTVITTKLGFSEFIKNEKEGIIIGLRNQEQLKKAIERLMGNRRLRNRLKMNARQTALKFDWDKIVKRYWDVYKGGRYEAIIYNK